MPFYLLSSEQRPQLNPPYRLSSWS